MESHPSSLLLLLCFCCQKKKKKKVITMTSIKELIQYGFFYEFYDFKYLVQWNDLWASLVTEMVKNLPAMQET